MVMELCGITVSNADIRLDMSRIKDIKEDKDVNKLFGMLFDEFGSGSINHLRMLFDHLSMLGVGYDGRLEKSGQIGVLDRDNMIMIQKILNNGELLNVLVRAWYYRVDVTKVSNLEVGLLLEEKVILEEE